MEREEKEGRREKESEGGEKGIKLVNIFTEFHKALK